MTAKERYDFYLNHRDLDKEDREELLKIKTDKALIDELFSYDLEFGTGGMRGIMALGSERINKYTVAKASFGIARYVLMKKDKASVVIGYDSRNNSKYFAKITADCFTSLGIRVYLFESLRPTPEISFAIRNLGASCGVIITASHNPKEYNGYKVYWSNGCQITAPVDKEIITYVKNEKAIKARFSNDDLITMLGEDMDKLYLEAVKEQALNKWDSDVKIVYTALNGTGGVHIPKLLREQGYEVFLVKEQAHPDGNFPTVPKPNPEDPEVYELAIKLAKEKEADLIIATDPDADRMGCFAKLKNGEYLRLSGNMSGALIGLHLLEEKSKSMKDAGKNPIIVKTIVTSKLIEKMAKDYGVEVRNTLTGFKYIGQLMDDIDFLFGMEESFGLLAGDYARDKDGVLAALLISELASKLKSRGSSIAEYIDFIYEKYGYSCDDIITMTFNSNKGKEIMNKMIADLRESHYDKIGGMKVISRIDYLNDDTGLPKSDVLFYNLEHGWFCIRRSGTEPKIKIYFEADSDDYLSDIKSGVKAIFND